MGEMIAELREFAVEQLPNLVIPISVLVVGWIVALVASSFVRRGLARTNLDDRIAGRILGEDRAAEIEPARWIGKVAYYIVLLLTLLAFLQVTQLTAASEPINAMLASVLEYIPLLFAAAAILFVAWLVATLTRALLSRALDRWQLDQRIQQVSPAPTEVAKDKPVAFEVTAPAVESPGRAPVSRAIAEAGYWLVFLLFLPAVLEALRLEGLLAPVQEMLNQVFGFAPNIASALVIGAAGWLVARVVQRLVANVLTGVGTDRLSERIGLSKALGKLTLSSLLGFIAYVLVLIPVAVGALNALELAAITRPASDMLEAFFAAVPATFGAALVLGIAYAAGRLLSGVVSKLLNGIGFDKVLTKIGFAREEIGERTPSDLVGGLVMIAVIYFAALESARLLNFTAVVALGSDFALLAGHVLLGLAIFGLGLYLGKLASDAVQKSDIAQAATLAIVTRVAVLGLAGGMALRQMGFANEIVELAFGLLVGAVAVACALAFGLGGREAAARALEDARARLQKREPPSSVPSRGSGLAG